jgi:hypothetical protein
MQLRSCTPVQSGAPPQLLPAVLGDAAQSSTGATR